MSSDLVLLPLFMLRSIGLFSCVAARWLDGDLGERGGVRTSSLSLMSISSSSSSLLLLLLVVWWRWWLLWWWSGSDLLLSLLLELLLLLLLLVRWWWLLLLWFFGNFVNSEICFRCCSSRTSLKPRFRLLPPFSRWRWWDCRNGCWWCNKWLERCGLWRSTSTSSSQSRTSSFSPIDGDFAENGNGKSDVFNKPCWTCCCNKWWFCS